MFIIIIYASTDLIDVQVPLTMAKTRGHTYTYVGIVSLKNVHKFRRFLELRINA